MCCTSYITALGTYSQCFAILGTNDVENKMTKPVELTDISSKISFLERTNNSIASLRVIFCIKGCQMSKDWICNVYTQIKQSTWFAHSLHLFFFFAHQNIPEISICSPPGSHAVTLPTNATFQQENHRECWHRLNHTPDCIHYKNYCQISYSDYDPR